MTMNVDFDGTGSPASLEEDVIKPLAKLQANFLSVISSDSNEAILDKLQLAAVPMVLVYDKTGQLRKRFDNDTQEYGSEGFSYKDDIGPFVRELLAESGN